MAITGSPDIFVSEQDLSTYVGNMDVTTAGFAGDFIWGPVGEVVRISDEARLNTYFGGPVARNYKDWFTAKNYLEYSNSLAISRVVLDSARNSYFIPQKDFIPYYRTQEEVDAKINELRSPNKPDNTPKTDAELQSDMAEADEYLQNYLKDPWDSTEGYKNKMRTASANEVAYQEHLFKIGEYSGNATTLVADSANVLTVSKEVINAFNEKIFYTPITEERSLSMSKESAIQSATVTNFPNYVAYTNQDGIYSIGQTSRQLYEAYGATPQNLMDLVPPNAGFDGEISQDVAHLNEVPAETLDSIGMCSVIACYNKPADGEKKKYYYLRKKYLGKFYEIVEYKGDYVVRFIPGAGDPDDTSEYKQYYILKDYGMNWGFKYAVDAGIYEDPKKPKPSTSSSSSSGSGNSDSETTSEPNLLYIESGEFKLHVNNLSDYYIQQQDVGKNEVLLMAKYPGNYGNRLHVSIINKVAYDAYKKVEKFKKSVSSLTAITRNRILDYLGNKEFENDSIAVAVSLWDETFETLTLKEYGIFSLTPGSLDITGYDNYIFNYFAEQSNYINLTKAAFENVYGQDLTKAWINIDVTLDGGLDYNAQALGGNDALYSEVTTTNSNGVDYDIESTATTVVTDVEYIKPYTPLINLVGGVGAYKKAWDLFRNEESDNTQVQLLMQGGGSPEIGQYIIDLAEKRKDCLACVSPTLSECVNVTDPCDRIASGTGKFYSNSSYAFMDGNYKYQYDAYNDCYRWIPLNGDMAGLFAYIDASEEPWMSIGGRQLRNCIKLAFYPSKADRDILFNANVNAVTNFSSEGNVVWGDWTRVNNSAFNFVGVRRCFLHIERNIVQYARKIMWKQNDTITRDQFVLAITPFLDSIVGGRGLQEYGIFAGADVTSIDEMDRGIFRAKIICKPVRSIRYIDLIFSAIRSDMSISEVVQ